MGCGGISLSREGPVVLAIVFLVLKPLAYFAFVHAFRYRVNREIPMTNGQALRLALLRAALGVVLAGVILLLFYYSILTPSELIGSWFYLYVGRFAAWFYVGAYKARIAGRRLKAWIFCGLLINLGFDIAAVVGAFAGWASLVVILVIAIFIAVLSAVGSRSSLKNRFASHPFCKKCSYNLTGNLSGICLECGTPIAPGVSP